MRHTKTQQLFENKETEDNFRRILQETKSFLVTLKNKPKIPGPFIKKLKSSSGKSQNSDGINAEFDRLIQSIKS